MPTLKRKLDFELCKNQMLCFEAELEGGDTTHFNFEQFTPENVAYNVMKLERARLIETRGPLTGEKGHSVYMPLRLTDKGRKFLEAAKDEARWQQAIEKVEAQGGTETLGPLVAALFASAREDS